MPSGTKKNEHKRPEELRILVYDEKNTDQQEQRNIFLSHPAAQLLDTTVAEAERTSETMAGIAERDRDRDRESMTQKSTVTVAEKYINKMFSSRQWHEASERRVFETLATRQLFCHLPCHCSDAAHLMPRL